MKTGEMEKKKEGKKENILFESSKSSQKNPDVWEAKTHTQSHI